jgi:rare lipoprotein A
MRKGPVHAGFMHFREAALIPRAILFKVSLTLAILVTISGCVKRSRANLPPPPARIGTTETGIASWYGVPYHGRRSASGEIFDMEKLTAAHKELPFQTWIEVTNLRNGKQVNVRITDRGPFVRGRIVDLSLAAAREIDMVRSGTDRVRLKVIAPPKEKISTSLPEPAASNDDTRHDDARQELYAVQAGAFADPDRAEALRSSIPFEGVRVEHRGSPLLWRVLVGHAMNKDAATALAEDLRVRLGAALVVRDE